MLALRTLALLVLLACSESSGHSDSSTSDDETAWQPGGPDEIWYGDITGTWRYDFGAGEVTAGVESGSAEAFRVSPGETMMAAQGGEGFEVWGLDGTRHTEVAQGTALAWIDEYHLLAASPYLGQDLYLVNLQVASGLATMLDPLDPNDDDIDVSTSSFSPDRGSVVLVAGGKVWVIEVASGSARSARTDDCVAVWLTDDRVACVGRQTATLFDARVEELASWDLEVELTGESVPWTPDTAALVSVHDDHETWLCDPESQAAVERGEDVPDSEIRHDCLATLDLETGALARHTGFDDLPHFDLGTLAISDDRTTAVYALDDTLQRARPDGAQRQDPHVAAGSIRALDW